MMQKYQEIEKAIPTVLVVDDDPAVCNSLKFSLEIEGFVVRIYLTGGDLLQDRSLPSFGCLIADYRLPGMTGMDLVAELRRRNISLPAILITTHPSAAVRARALSAGVPIVEKPLLGDTLLRNIHDALAIQFDRLKAEGGAETANGNKKPD